MPWTVSWLDDQEQVIELIPVDPWDWDEFKHATQRAQAMTVDKAHKVDLVYNLGDDLTLPKGDEAHAAPWLPMRDVLLQTPPNRGLVVLIAAPLFIESIVKNLQSAVKDQRPTKNIRFAETMREARQALNEARTARGDAPLAG